MIILADSQLSLSVGLVALLAIVGAIAAFFGKTQAAICCLAVAILFLVAR